MIAGWPVVLGAALAVVALPVVAAGAYLVLLTLLSKRVAPIAYPAPRLRFDIVVPAHNEETVIAATIRSLLAVDYPRSLYRLIVVADNCDDRTAECARAACALVLERRNAGERGKGYALAHAYAASLADAFADVVVVVDADTVVSPNLLAAIGARVAQGADAVQADYGVRNVHSAWRTRLMAIAFTCFHQVRSLARERLGLSCGLRGNGMAFTCALLRRVPHDAFSVVEDLEYGIQLGYAGIRVAYAGEAHVLGDMPASSRTARSQRDRWEGGRRTIARMHAAGLLRAALARRDLVLLDLAIDLLVPSLSTLLAASVAGAAISVLALRHGYPAVPAVVLWSSALFALAIHVSRGCVLAGTGARVVVDLMLVPGYVLWKLAMRWRPSRSARGEWVRTSRASES